MTEARLFDLNIEKILEAWESAHHQHDHAPGTAPGEPHCHRHRHAPMVHRHSHYPDLHHRHRHNA